MKKKIFIIVIVLIFLVAILLYVFLHKEKKEENTINYYNIRYVETINGNEVACLTFYNEDKYSLYDCDSEPTDYAFDSEWECTPTYNKENNYMKFDCKYNDSVTIKITKWDEKEFRFIYNGEERIFVANNKEES